MPTIRIEDDVFNGLKSIAEPFSDTPNSVIRRLLEEKGVLRKPGAAVEMHPKRDSQYGIETKDPKPTNKNSLTPQPIYEKFLHHVLATEFNGRGGKHDVTAAVIKLMKARGYIGPDDLEVVSSGETKAENTVAWGRNALKDNQIISRNSRRGIWELTPDGMQKAKVIVLPTKESDQS